MVPSFQASDCESPSGAVSQLGISYFGEIFPFSIASITMIFHDNSPQVTCDTISLIVEGETYNMDYDFGRRGVRDLGWLVVVMMRIKIIKYKVPQLP